MSDELDWLKGIDTESELSSMDVLVEQVEDMWGNFTGKLHPSEISHEDELKTFTSKIAFNLKFGLIRNADDPFPQCQVLFYEILNGKKRYQDMNSIMEDPEITEDNKIHIKEFTKYFTPSEGVNKHRDIRHLAIWTLYFTNLWDLAENIQISMGGSKDDIGYGGNDDLTLV